MKSILNAILYSVFAITAYAQPIQGILTNDDKEPLFGATLYWEGTTNGTVADINGWYQLMRPKKSEGNLNLHIDYVGYETTIFEILPNEDTVHLSINGVSNLMQVEVAAKIRDNYISTIQTMNIETIGGGELKKAACCSLADCFETNASVDVTYADAISGAKEIEVLGLRGIYTAMLVEKRPALNGLGTSLGLDFIPGTWINSISIAKGTGSVQSGFNAITGQINSEIKKPFDDYPVFVNLYASTMQRFEANVHLNKEISKKWSTGLLLHGGIMQNEIDNNDDNYLESPLKKTLNGMYRVFYRTNTWRSQFNVHAVNDERMGGNLKDTPDGFYAKQKNKRVEAFGKVGFIGFNKPTTTVGFLYNASWHKLDNYYGPILHSGTQRNIFTQFIYESLIGTSTNHKLYSGVSFMYDDYEELVDKPSNDDNDINNDRTEKVPGVFVEYMKCNGSNIFTDFNSKIGIVAGLRVDHHNNHGVLVSPRLNMKYNFDENTIIRVSAGRAYRSPNVIAENLSIFSSSRGRRIDIREDLDIEAAINVGFNFTKTFEIAERAGQVSLDVYRTEFDKQVVLDLDEKYNEAIFYNLDGQSYSNSVLALVRYDLFERFTMKVAYKYNDVKIEYSSGLRQKPLVARHRGLVTMDYETANEQWSFSTSAQFVGKQRFPDNEERSPETVKDHTGSSPAYALVNTQVTKKFKKWDIYMGGENLLNYTQKNPIISGDNWESDDFDASQVYAPIMGTRVYVGLRWWIDKK
ncbi:MAG: outer membrane receptor for ferrienterochelin and colicins [Flavobacteriales bacterium]|jgi:outer membrane receptor for ferrienterochelin and colicins